MCIQITRICEYSVYPYVYHLSLDLDTRISTCVFRRPFRLIKFMVFIWMLAVVLGADIFY